MKLSKYNLKLSLKRLNVDIDSDSGWEDILDGIYSRIDLNVGPFYREIANRDFFIHYEEKYPLYADMHKGVKSNFVSRVLNNDMECLILVHDSVLSGLDGLFVVYSTECKSSMMEFINSIKFGFDVFVKTFNGRCDVGDEGTAYIGFTPARCLITKDSNFEDYS